MPPERPGGMVCTFEPTYARGQRRELSACPHAQPVPLWLLSAPPRYVAQHETTLKDENRLVTFDTLAQSMRYVGRSVGPRLWSRRVPWNHDVYLSE